MEATPDVLFDSTVILGALLADDSHGDACAAALALAEAGRIRGHVCAAAVGALHDELARARGTEHARTQIGVLRGFLGVLATTDAILDAALAEDGLYLDDAITYASARGAGLDLILTLNCGDFATRATAIPAQLPRQLLTSIGTAGEA